MKKELWYSQRGWLKVKVRAEQEESIEKIEFDCVVFVADELSNYDVLEYIDDLIRPIAYLQKAYRPEVIDVIEYAENDTYALIKMVLDKYSPEDYKLFYDTVEMLCAKGVGNGCYQDYTVLIDVVQILALCEEIVKGGDAK